MPLDFSTGGRGGAAPAAAPSSFGGGFQPISGSLPFGGGGAGAMSNPSSAYASAYNDSLQMNKQNYANILAGYNQTMQSQQSAQQGISAGYGQLSGDVMGLIAGTDSAQRQAIADQYQANRGQASQSLIDRGLGNTTIQSSVDRGLQYDRTKADTNLSDQFAQLNAQYRTQLGLAGLDYQNQANMQNTALASQQFGFMNSVNAQYPNASQYANLAMMKGQLKGGGIGGAGMMGGGAVGGFGSAGGMKLNPSFGNSAAGSFMSSPSSGYGSNAYGSSSGFDSPDSIYPATQSLGPWDAPLGTQYGADNNYGLGYGNAEQPYTASGYNPYAPQSANPYGDGAPTEESGYDY